METKEKMQDEILWAVAKKRASFKKSLVTYLIVNTFLWILWAIGDKDNTYSILPWPIWSTIGWGFGIAFQYANAYIFHSKMDAVEKEYEKLKTKGR